MRVYFISPADKELEDAFQYYEEQMHGLGDKFIEDFLYTVDLITRTPFAWRKISKNTRRINVKRFPYLILYIVEEPNVFITCVAHAHRDPTY